MAAPLRPARDFCRTFAARPEGSRGQNGQTMLQVTEPAEQERATAGGGRGGRTGDQAEHRAIQHATETERSKRVPGIERCASTSKESEAGEVHGPAAPSDC